MRKQIRASEARTRKEIRISPIGTIIRSGSLACLLSAATVLGISGCGGKSTQQGEGSANPPKPKEAASQLQQAFVAAEPEMKETATIASKALQTTDYDAALVSLQAIKERGNLSFEQGMAVHNSMVALEAKLVEAADSGDPAAKQDRKSVV